MHTAFFVILTCFVYVITQYDKNEAGRVNRKTAKTGYLQNAAYSFAGSKWKVFRALNRLAGKLQ